MRTWRSAGATRASAHSSCSSLTTAASYIEMPQTGYPHPYGKHNTEKDRGRFVFQIIVR